MSERATLSIAITGSGGAGIITAGDMLLEAAARGGWYGMLTRSVGPQIRGGEAASLIHLADRPVQASPESFDILLAVDWNNVARFADEIPLRADSMVIADAEAGEAPGFVAAAGATIIELPLSEFAKEVPGGRVNMVAVGLIAGLTGLPNGALRDAIASALSDKGEAAVTASIAAAAAGRTAADGLDNAPALPAAAGDGRGRWLINGNQAAGLGAVRGGVRFVAAYPITPATEVLEWMAPALNKVGGVLVQAEDELASINMIIGASFGGAPSLTATSGPGLALMSESIGLAATAEVPVVVVDVMRVGPSTGIPTKSEQSDLNAAIYGQHGDAPHLVVAPVSVADCLFTTSWAVHLAETLQMPAIVLSDQFLGQARSVIDPPAQPVFDTKRAAATPGKPYRRYAVTATGISPMALPGLAGGQHTADGLEHSDAGTPSSGAADHVVQMDKRQAKLDRFDFGDAWADIEGDGDFALITWGSCTGPCREALDAARAEGRSGRLLSLRLLLPAQPDRLSAALDGVRRILVVEQTHSGQLYRYLRAAYDLPGEVRGFHRPGPLPLRLSAILEQIKEWS